MDDYTNHLMPRKVRPTRRGGYSGTILIVLAAVAFWMLLAIWAVATAQTSTSEANSSSGALASSGSASQAGAQIVTYGQKPGKGNTVYTDNRIESAPSLGGLALGGGHPCAYSPATAQISIIGGGAGIGGSKVDSACMLMVMGAAGDKKAYKAAQLMLAARDPAACRAMEAAGLVTCGDKETTAAVASASGTTSKDFSAKGATANPAPSTKGGSPYGLKCEKVGKKIKFQASSAAARASELAACKARF
jgi:hypothetical protein